MPDTYGIAAAGFSCQSPGYLSQVVAGLAEMRPNALVQTGYMFGCGHEIADLLFDG